MEPAKKYIIDKETRKVYNYTFMKKNTDEIHKQICCDICGGQYTYFNKSRHMKTRKHMFFILRDQLTQKVQ
jgi:hypothetical protein